MKDNGLLTFQVSTLLLSSRPLAPVDAVLVHARSFGGDDDGIFRIVGQANSLATVVVVNGSDGRSKDDPTKMIWPGADNYAAALSAWGVRDVIRSEPATHTREESMKFTDLIEKMEWKRVMVVNGPHYLLRTMLGALNEVRKRKLDVKLFPVAPGMLDWTKPVNGTQGSDPAARFLQIAAEFKRVEEYRVKYPDNFSTIEELIEYLTGLNG
ncbi:MAG: hypothetical protein WC767_02020 [Candidatus Paceibacterota bacterium]|jgi:hypothetical protein